MLAVIGMSKNWLIWIASAQTKSRLLFTEQKLRSMHIQRYRSPSTVLHRQLAVTAANQQVLGACDYYFFVSRYVLHRVQRARVWSMGTDTGCNLWLAHAKPHGATCRVSMDHDHTWISTSNKYCLAINFTIAAAFKLQKSKRKLHLRFNALASWK